MPLSTMRKGTAPGHQQNGALADHNWLDVEGFVEVEVTSEALAYPIECALLPEPSAGWRAGWPGPQTIRLHFQPPQHLTRIGLCFVEVEIERTQEYTLRWSPDYGESFHEIVRQQWNFSPQGAPREVEDHGVQLPSVAILELQIIPDIRVGTKAVASLAQWRLA
jgi:hypothetical protein